MFSANTTQVADNAANYIEDVFSTWLYTGNGTVQTITNNIDLSTKGGMVWMKSRSAATDHAIYDTARGALFDIASNTTGSQTIQATGLTAFGTTGFTIGALASINTSAATYTSWTFRKQPKFFDIVTYTGDGASQRQIAHSLGSVPGFITIKTTSSASNWWVAHRGNGSTMYESSTSWASNGLNLTNALPSSTYPGPLGTSTYFQPTWNGSQANVNVNGETYVAYLFAHNAGGFGTAGTDNVISCGSYTGNAATQQITLGYEPQFLLIKQAGSSGNSWLIFDNMRGFSLTAEAVLAPNTSNPEFSLSGLIYPTATGFFINTAVGSLNDTGTYIYIAIRRGPMKTPTVGTSVFAPVLSSTTGATSTSNFPVDMVIAGSRGTQQKGISDRLRGFAITSSDSTPWLVTQTTAAETSPAQPTYYNAINTSIQTGSYLGGISLANYLFQRAPGFFDEVCSSNFIDGTPINHNLGITPELIVVKTRGLAAAWMGAVNEAGNIRNLSINTNSGGWLPSLVYSSYFNATTINPAGIFNGAGGDAKGIGVSVVIYLFATVVGVSKIGSYTGTGALQTVNCSFTTGARFVLIKRTDSTGDWYVWDSARGISSGNDPYLLLNTTGAEVTSTNYVDTDATGFKVTAAAPADLNASGGTYIFLAIA
jgi:hypothetical protein